MTTSHLSTPSELLSRQHNPPVTSHLRVPKLIGDSFVESKSLTFIDVINPATQEVVSQVPCTTEEEFPSWRNTPMTKRQRVMLKFQELIRRDMDKLALNNERH
ncbi:Methylmalonate-semialdehyde dehydrogenase [acylating], mitochondrial, partial [Mucuna pruriens]